MLTAIIVDDKPLAIEILVAYVGKIDCIELKATFTDPLKGLAFIESNDIDIAFLDIQMPELTGIQFMRIAGSRTRFILTTAYPDYAVEGFEYNAVDYLVKPVPFERFYLAVQKAKQLIENKTSSNSIAAQPAQKDFIFIKTDKKIKKLLHKEILFAEARQNYVEFVTSSEKLLALQTMKQTEELLPPELFCRVHKSYIVNLSAIDTIDQHVIYIKSKVIPVGEIYRNDFYKKLSV